MRPLSGFTEAGDAIERERLAGAACAEEDGYSRTGGDLDIERKAGGSELAGKRLWMRA